MKDDIDRLLEYSKKEALKWLEYPIESGLKDEINFLLEKGNEEDLIESFHKKLEFGTGGMRGIIGVGSNKINKYTVGFSTQGLSNYLISKYDSNISVVIAYDNRKFSRDFAMFSAKIFSANKIKAFVFKDLRPTPELSYAVRELKCNCGIVITASHNPKEYNGYKVYWSDGGQIVSPHDKLILKEVNKLKDISSINVKEDNDLIKIINKEIDDKYIKKISKLSFFDNSKSKLKIVYTPIHGTGITQVPNALKAFGFKNIIITKSQEMPDPNFITVKSPNPEDPDALKISIEDLKENDADILLATDPDSDRVGVAIKRKNEVILINGNQLGSVIIYFTLTMHKKNNTLPYNSFTSKTIVTTPLIEKISRDFGVNCYSTLTGFKYIAELIKSKTSEKFIAGGEESYGYLIDDFVRDKDAVISSAVICEIASWCKNNNRDLIDLINDLYNKYGFFEERLFTIKLKGIKGQKKINNIMTEYRNNTPKKIYQDQVINVIDYNKTTNNSIIKSKSDVIQIFTKKNFILTIRPSGTEPKIKFYFSVTGKNERNNIKFLKKLINNEIEKIKKRYA